jgi:hypothetical protein
MGDWSSGMIPALGAGGREFDSRITPFCSPCNRFIQVIANTSQRQEELQKNVQPDAGLEPATSRLRACHSTD